jgi:hypothetical protein
MITNPNLTFRRLFLPGCIFAILALTGCAPAPEPEAAPDTSERLDTLSRPPQNEIMPPQGALLGGPPQTLDFQGIAGSWQYEGCRLVLDGEGLTGGARAQGDCPDWLSAAAGWQIEPEHRMRLTLFDEAGTDIWSGVWRADGHLAGIARGHGGAIFTR